MDVISVGGIDYVKASSLAKEFKYTSDYIGQLCRSRKVDAQLVGRTWYVNRDSLESHRSSRYSKTDYSVDDKSFEYKVKINKSRVDVKSTVSNKTAKLISHSHNFAKRVNWKPLKYEYDASDLMPHLADIATNQKLNIELADASKISVKNLSENSEMEADDLPVVSLSGGVNVVSFEDKFAVDEEFFDKKGTIDEENNIAKESFLVKNNGSEIKSLARASVDYKQESASDFRLQEIVSWLFILFLFLLMILLFFVDVEVVANADSYKTDFRFSLQIVQDILTIF